MSHTRLRTTRGIALFGFHSLLLLLGIGCGTEVGGVTWIEAAADSHRAADSALREGEPSRARLHLASALRRQPPEDIAAADGRRVQQDIYYRLAEIEMGMDRAQQALGWAEEGLLLGRADDVFTANLLVVLGRSLEETDRPREAAVAYIEAQRITEGLLRQQLGPAPNERSQQE